MDEAVKPAARAVLSRRMLALALMLAAGVPARAQALQDPTRPPAAVAAGFGADKAAGQAGPQLQTVLIGRGAGGRHLAVIDGETVRIGDAFHGARVAAIRDNEVVLARGRARQVLRLYDSAAGAITPVRAAPAAPAAAATPRALAAAQR